MIHTVDSLEKMAQVACDFVKELEQNQQATVFGLKGNLGSGKTTFVQNVAKCLGIKEDVTSPTFVIQKIYEIQGNNEFTKLIHIDAYRLSAGEDLAKLEFQKLLKNREALIFIEWPENVLDALPENTKYTEFKFINETKREIIYASKE